MPTKASLAVLFLYRYGVLLSILAVAACATAPPRPTSVALATDPAWWQADSGVQASLNSEIRFSSWERSGRYVIMPDSTRIAVELYLPSGLPAGERVPTVLVQTRYYRAVEFRWPASRKQDGVTFPLLPGFIRRGYAVVVTDVRGTGASFGRRDAEWSPAEVRDGATIVDWIISQPWSNGLVGATGLSYPGTTAELLLVNHHPAVRAVAPLFAPWDLYADLAFPGGAFLHAPTRAWSELTQLLDRNDAARGQGWRARLAFRGVRAVDGPGGRRQLRQALDQRGRGFDVFAELSAMAFRDDTSTTGWSFGAVSPHARIHDVKQSGAAVYSYSGWFDGAHNDAAIKRFLALDDPQHRLVLGPWGHSLSQNASPYSPNPRTAFPHAQELIRFFDYHLKGIDHGFSREDPIHYFTIGEEVWKSAAEWPIPGTEYHALYFGSDRTLAFEAPLSGEGADTLNPASVGSGVASRWHSLVGGRPVKYTEREALATRVLSYTSAPLAADMEVTGYPVMRILVRTTNEDAHFFVYLEEIDPSGEVRYITEGALRAVHRRQREPAGNHPAGVPFRSFRREDAEPLASGEVAELEFALLPVSWLIRAGHRVRVAIAPTDRDNFGPAHDMADHVTELLWGQGARSRIDLPVVPR